MREILFKAKPKDWRDISEKSWWVEGYYAMMGKENLVRHYIVQNCALTGLFGDPEENMYFNDVEIDPETLCQYTGLKDKNGNRIWDSDIIRVENSADEGTGKVEFFCGMWYVDGEPSNSLYDIMEYDDAAEVEVIGNIFDNPELMKKENGMHIKIKQGIDNCYMVHRYEHPGYENDLCAGLRTMNGDGDPCDTCKECYLYYGNPMWNKED